MEKKNTIFPPYLMMVFAFIGLTIACYDSYAIYNGYLLWCPPPIDGCNIVAYSPYGRFYGVPFGYLGVVFYLLMFVYSARLALASSSHRLRLGAICYSVIGVASSICFMYIDIVYIKAFCVYCAISAILTVLLLISAIAHYRAIGKDYGLIAMKSKDCMYN